MENHVDFFTMEFTLEDILMFLSLMGGLLGVWIFHTNRTTRLEARLDSFMDTTREKTSDIQASTIKNRESIEQERRYVVEKLAQIESGQSRTNVFLEENLKRLTAILESHEKEIIGMRERLAEYDSGMKEFYRDFELTKKNRSELDK